MSKVKMYVIYGAGYGGRTMDVFLSTLVKNGIDLVADIRSFPVSRHWISFSKTNLMASLASVGIGYSHEGRSIGGKLENFGFDEKIDSISELVKKGLKVCLLCTESRPEQCHRTTILKPEFAKRGITLVELVFPKKI
jgi:uncharacterized protein (DUF488 family)